MASRSTQFHAAPLRPTIGSYGVQGQVWSAAEPVRDDQGMSTARRLSWESPWVLVGFLVANLLMSLNGVRRGDVSETVVWAGGAVICAWLLISRRRLKRHPPSWDQATTAAFRVALGFSIVGLGFAVLFAIWAIQTSGGERILWAIGAGMLAAGGAFFVLFTVAIHRLRSQRRLARQSYGTRGRLLADASRLVAALLRGGGPVVGTSRRGLHRRGSRPIARDRCDAILSVS
jgi:hypothetical protein